MDKVRFACPRCRTVMQTGAEKVGYDVVCPHCTHRFRLVEPESSPEASSDGSVDREAATMPPMPSQAPPSSGSWGAQQPSPKPMLPVTGASYHAPMSSQQTTGGGTYACPYCGTNAPPVWKSEVSTIGWIVFAVLLVTTCVFCFVGLFIRDQYRVCSRCKVRLG